MKTNAKLIIKTAFFAVLLLVIQGISFGQEEDQPTPLELSGSVDAYFRANLNGPNDENAVAPGSSFANQPGFSIGMVNLIASMDGEKVGFVGDLVFGPRGNDAVFGSTAGSTPIVNQLYAYWKVSDVTTISMGNFNTFLGYEVISPTANFNYSTSYMFSYGPFSHTGVKADFALSDNVSAMLGVMNPTDATEFNPVGSYTYGAQLGVGGFYLNFLYGDQDGSLDESTAVDGDVSVGNTFQVDLTGGADMTDNLYLGINATYNATSAGEVYSESSATISDVDGDGAGFYGVAGYAQLATSDVFSIGTRVEYFNAFNGFGADEDGLGTIVGLDEEGDGSVVTFTLSGQYQIDNLTIIPEFRIDSSSENTFIDNDLAPSKSLASFVLAAVYAF